VEIFQLPQFQCLRRLLCRASGPVPYAIPFEYISIA
jgi:hypothetical protein